MRRIGLLGGTSWESTVEYYRLLNEGVRDRLGGLHSADLVLRSVDFAEIAALQEAGDWGALGERYAAEAATLRAGGAQLLGICANTMHLVHDDVVRGAGLPVVHVVDAVADAVAGEGLTRLALLGTRYTMESDLYPARLAGRGIEVLVPEGDDAAEVNRVIYAELVLGRVEPTSAARLRAVVADLVDRGAQAVVLGCTELAMILDPDGHDLPVPVFDSMSLHVNALLEAAFASQGSALEEGAAA